MDTGKLDAIDKFGHPFQTWLRRECFKKPTPEAFDLARSAWKEQDKRIAELEEEAKASDMVFDVLQARIEKYEAALEGIANLDVFHHDLTTAQYRALDALEGE